MNYDDFKILEKKFLVFLGKKKSIWEINLFKNKISYYFEENNNSIFENEIKNITLLDKLNDKKLKLSFLDQKNIFELKFISIVQRDQFKELLSLFINLFWSPYLFYDKKNSSKGFSNI
jgi:hypothetical protein